MNIQIKARGIPLTDAIESYILKKFESLKKFLKNQPDDIHFLVEVGKTSRHHKKGDVFRADVNVKIDGKNLYASSEKEDMYAAIDDLKDEMTTELVKAKDKKVSKIRKTTLKAKEMIKGIK